jgi:hypothetical protein
VLRNVIDRVELLPRADGKRLDAYLYGELAAILALCEGGKHKQKLPRKAVPGSQLSVVARARNRLDLQLRELLKTPIVWEQTTSSLRTSAYWP